MTFERPDTQYTCSGEFSIAYQVFGEGSADLIYLPHWMSNVEANWDVEPIARFLRGLARDEPIGNLHATRLVPAVVEIQATPRQPPPAGGARRDAEGGTSSNLG